MTHYRGGWAEGGGAVGGEGGWRWVKTSIGTAWTSYASQKCQPWAQTCLDGLRDDSLSLQGEVQAHAFHVVTWSALHGSDCLSHEFTGSAKLVVEKQTSQPSLIMALCMCCVEV